MLMTWQKLGQACSDSFILLAVLRSILLSHTHTHTHTHPASSLYEREHSITRCLDKMKVEMWGEPVRRVCRTTSQRCCVVCLCLASRRCGGCWGFLGVFSRRREVRMREKWWAVCCTRDLARPLGDCFRVMCAPPSSSSALSIFLLPAVPPFGRCSRSPQPRAFLPSSSPWGRTGAADWRCC